MIKPEHETPNVAPFRLYLDAFFELSTCRQTGMGISPIPFVAVVEYAKIYEVGDFHDFLYIIRRMDSKLLELDSKKQKDNGNGKASKGNKGRS